MTGIREITDRVKRPQVDTHEDLHLILDAIPTPLSWATMPDGQIRFVNRAFIRTFGYTLETLPTVDAWIDIAFAGAEDQRRARRRWAELWTSNQRGTSELEPVELEVRRADGTTVTVQHRGILLHEAGVAIATFEDITAQKLAEDSLRRIAFEDPLTGLPNRRALQARWIEAVAQGATSLALLILDLDRFKPVNDLYGHETGDMVLAMVARRLESCAAPGFVARLGGDEFAILVQDDDAPATAERVCAAIVDVLARPFTVPDGAAQLNVTIGLSRYPADGTELSVLMRRADEALYRQKRAGRTGWQWYGAELA